MNQPKTDIEIVKDQLALLFEQNERQSASIKGLSDRFAYEVSQHMTMLSQCIDGRIQALDTLNIGLQLVTLQKRMESLESQVRRLADTDIANRIGKDVTAVVNTVERLNSIARPTGHATTEQMVSVVQKLDNLAAGLAMAEHAKNKNEDASAFVRLENLLGDLSAKVERLAHGVIPQQAQAESASQMRHLAGRVEQLASTSHFTNENLKTVLSSIDGIAHSGASSLEVVRHLGLIYDRISAIESSGSSVSDFARTIEDMVLRLNDFISVLGRTNTNSIADEQFATLISEVRSVSRDINYRTARMDAFVQKSEELVGEAALRAAALAAQNRSDADSTEVRMLSEDLRKLEDTNRATGERTYHTFEALHGVVRQMSTKLIELERQNQASAPQDPRRSSFRPG